jgi:hypothetical protein
MAMHLLDAVRCSLAGEVMSLHDTGVAAALAGPRNVNAFEFCKLIDSDRRADFQVGFTSKLAHETLWLAIRLGGQFDTAGGTLLGPLTLQLGYMAPLASNCQATRLVLETQLNGLITISVVTANLQHATRTGLDDRHGNRRTVFRKDLCHPDFAAKD